MKNNNLINIQEKGETIDFNEVKKKIENDIQNNKLKDISNEEGLIREISNSRYEFTVELVKNMLIKRDKKNLTQSELAKLSNVNRTTIAKLESFQRLVVNLDVILRLLDALDLKLTISDK
ncbi:MAG: helix-turn-helix transcriptional regulator [Eubacterium sp.]